MVFPPRTEMRGRAAEVSWGFGVCGCGHPHYSRSGDRRYSPGTFEVGGQEAVEEVLAGFAADGEAAGVVGARVQAALHRLADGYVFVLNAVAYGDAFFVVASRGFADIGEVEI